MPGPVRGHESTRGRDAGSRRRPAPARVYVAVWCSLGFAAACIAWSSPWSPARVPPSARRRAAHCHAGLADRHAGRAADCVRAHGDRSAPEARRTAGTSWRWRSRAARGRQAIPKYYTGSLAGHRAGAGHRAKHLEARKLQVWILLGQHEFPRAVDRGRSDQQADAGRCAGLWLPGRRLHRAGPLRGGGEGGAVDAGHAARQRSRVDPRRAPARAVRRSRRRRRADGHVVSPHRATPKSRTARGSSRRSRTSRCSPAGPTTPRSACSTRR